MSGVSSPYEEQFIEADRPLIGLKVESLTGRSKSCAIAETIYNTHYSSARISL